MYPYLFNVEFLDTYNILLIVGLFSAVLLFKFICSKKKVDDATYNFFSLLGIVSIAMGLVFAVLFQSFYNFLESGVFQLKGMTFMGGLIGGALTFILGTLFIARPKVKVNFWKMANYAAPCIVLGHLLGRIGCFLAGCCYGKATDSFLGVQFPFLSHKVHATQLYEAFFLLALFAVMMILLFKYRKENFLLLLYGASYAIFRFLIEFLRGDERGNFVPGLSPSQMQSIILLLITAALAVMIYGFKKIPFYKKLKEQPPEDKSDSNVT